MKKRMANRRLLRIRPGHLANFSGGAGYMPFIVMFSVPASVLFNVVGSLVLFLGGRRLLERDEDPKMGLYEFRRFALIHTLVCICVAVVAGAILFFMGQDMVYGSKLEYAPATLVFTAGPIVAWILSSLSLLCLMVARGPRASNLLAAAAAYFFLLLGCIPLLWVVSILFSISI